MADDLIEALMKATADGYADGEWDSGCADCSADVELARDPEHSLILHALIYHEDWCRDLARREHRTRTAKQRREARRHGYL